jgi:hypothetical protein
MLRPIACTSANNLLGTRRLGDRLHPVQSPRRAGSRYGPATGGDRAAILALLSGAHRPTRSEGTAACPQALQPRYGHATRTRPARVHPAAAPRTRNSVAESAGQVEPDQSLARWSVASSWVSVSVVALFAAALGVVRLEGRRSRACRWSRGRRPSGCDSEATGRPAGLPQ